jgi:hypothetical protein
MNTQIEDIYHFQHLCYDSERNANCKFWVAIDNEDSKTNGKMYMGFESLQVFIKWRDQREVYQPMYYEQMKGACNEFYDIDGVLGVDKVYYDEHEKKYIMDPSVIIENFIDARIDFQETIFPDIPLKREHFFVKITPPPKDKNKFSAHIVIRNGYAFENCGVHLKTFTELFTDYIVKDEVQHVTFDRCVYTMNRNFRTLGSHKKDEPERVAQRFIGLRDNKSETCEEWCFYASYITRSIFYDIVDKDTAEIQKIFKETNWDKHIDASDDVVTKLTNMILETVDNQQSVLCDGTNEHPDKMQYKSWNMWMCCISNCCDDENIRRALLHKSVEYYRHRDGVKDSDDKLVEHYNSQKGIYPWNMYHLHKWAKIHSDYLTEFKEQDKKIQVVVKRLMFDLRERKAVDNEGNPSKIEFVNQIPEFVEKTKNEYYNKKGVKAVLKGMYKRVTMGSKIYFYMNHDYYCANTKNRVKKFDMTDKINDLTGKSGSLTVNVRIRNHAYKEEMKTYEELVEHVKDLEEDEKSVTKRDRKAIENVPSDYMYISLGTIFTEMLENNEIENYNRPTFHPYLDTPPPFEDSLNTFLGFPYEHNPKMDVSPYTNSRFYENLKTYLCNGEDTIFEWYEDFIAHTIQHPNELPSKMVVFISEQGTGKDAMFSFFSRMIGGEHALQVPSMDSFMTKFNGIQANRLLVRINELSTKGVHFERHELLKEYISRDNIEIEKKGIDTISMPHRARYIGFSQHENVLKVENSDRRLCMIRCNNDKANDKAWFSKIFKEIEDETILKAAFNYYANRDIGNFMIKDIPMTEYKQEQVVLNIPNPLKYIASFFDDKPDEYITDTLFTGSLYLQYNAWISEMGITAKHTRISFVKILKDFGLEERRYRIGKADNKKNGFKIGKDEVRDLMRAFLKSKTWDYKTCLDDVEC